MEVDRQRAVDVATAAFESHGISASDAELTAEVLVSANARGKHSHGLLRLPRFIRGIEHGNVDPDGDIEITAERGSSVTLSGGSRLGPVVASEAAVLAMERADEFGIGAIGVHDTNHLGMLGYYTDLIRSDGYVGVAITNTEPAMPPHGGTEPILGTNPIAIGLPTDPVFNLDMSTSAIARGTVLHKKAADEPIPEDRALDATGEPTTDPDAALQGMILPFGGVKGSGIAIAIEVLAGGLVGAAMGTAVTGTYHTKDPCTKGDLFLTIDPEAFGNPNFASEASAFLRDMKRHSGSTTDEIRLPGERSVRRDRDRETVEIEDDCWQDVCALAEPN
ncbi:Ldh family oxidoreductase [Halocatena marina]|uniref:Ldh family oxidoreductase n=1 Tax=Halocatena marina TaxID=2934937 RepID=A0ABD5YHD0_9EURY|nr:Ldh family oxidoreductase [Halocatena marina]